MAGVTFIEQLKRSWRQILYYGGGLAFMIAFVMSIMQDVTVLEAYGGMIERMPPALLSSIGIEDAAVIATPEGFASFAGLTYGSIILAVFAVMAGLDVTANDEDEGIMNVLLSLPIPRWRVVVERSLAYGVIVVGIASMVFVGMIIGSFLTPLELDLMKLLPGCINLIPAGWVLMAATIFFASIISNKVIATGVSAAFVFASYILNVVGESVTEGSFGYMISRASVWSYFDVQGAVQHGLNYVNVGGIVALTVVLLFASTFAFERRDIA